MTIQETPLEKQLMVGNIVLYGKDYVRIDMVSASGNISLTDMEGNNILPFYPIYAKDVTPIALSEEILLKAGFKANDIVYWIAMPNLKSELHIEVYPNEVVCTIQSGHMELILDAINHLHQLQNLYFALTGTELTINL